jgi:aminoglycoside 3-N-acetyltransferase
MPAFVFGDPVVGSVVETFKKNPRFDLRRTPSQMGLATELFRRSPGVVQSRHPVYRVSAFGPLAGELVRGHENAVTPSGKGTPFDFMAEHDTQIIGLGKTIEILTQVHHAEAIMGDDFPVPRNYGDGIEVILQDGKEELMIQLKQNGLQWERDMAKLRQIMQGEMLREWTFHHVPLFATRARDVTGCIIEAAQKGITLYRRP